MDDLKGILVELNRLRDDKTKEQGKLASKHAAFLQTSQNRQKALNDNIAASLSRINNLEKQVKNSNNLIAEARAGIVTAEHAEARFSALAQVAFQKLSDFTTDYGSDEVKSDHQVVALSDAMSIICAMPTYKDSDKCVEGMLYN